MKSPSLLEIRSKQKAASRVRQARQLAAGERSAEEIQRENSAFSLEWVQSRQIKFYPRASRH